MKNIFKILPISESEWNEYWNKVNFNNLTQCFEYGVSKSINTSWTQLNYLIKSDNGNDLGVVQVLKKRFLFLDIFRINRGPLLLDENINNENIFLKYEILNFLKANITNNLFSFFFVAPEIENSNTFFKFNFFKRKNKISYGSSRINLKESEENLLMNINSKWRNMLRKSEKTGIIIEKSNLDKENLAFLLKFYNESQKKNNFIGVPNTVLKSLASQSSETYNFNYYVSKSPENNQIIGILVSIRHGSTSTYLIGASDSDGRKYNANYAMLWAAILNSKKNGCLWYDLGGINENTTVGIKRFKTRLNGQNYSLVGEYWSFKLF
jgi:hypothetical protein